MLQIKYNKNKSHFSSYIHLLSNYMSSVVLNNELICENVLASGKNFNCYIYFWFILFKIPIFLHYKL